MENSTKNIRILPNKIGKHKYQKLIDAYLSLEEQEALDANALGFMARVLVQATLPHRDPGETQIWGRQNGSYAITMQPGTRPGPSGKPIAVGLPYGNIPRLLMIWITTEAIRTKKRELLLGHTLSEFMRQLDLVPTGGRWGNVTRLRDQMRRMFSARIAFSYEETNNDSNCYSFEPINIGKTYLWWDANRPEQADLWQSTIVLSEEFFDYVTQSPIPIDMRAIKAFRQSSMELDIYTWLTYRMSYLKKPTPVISWKSLSMQFGSEYSRLRDFKSNFITRLQNVLSIYDAKIDTSDEGLILKPSRTHIPAVPKSILTNL